MAIIHEVDTWKPYLMGCHFHIKIDHQRLKYFLEQRLSYPEQHKWVKKMLDYDYEIIHKKGNENVVVDAMSRQFEEEASLFAL